jgi:hypothetical protein
MRIYTYAGRQTSRPSLNTHSAKHRADFARAAVLEEFRTRNARAIDYDGFVDRRPNEPPRPVPEVWQRKAQWAGLPSNAESLVPGPPNNCVPEAIKRLHLSVRPFCKP